MPKRVQSISFKNAEFRVNVNENEEKVIWILEQNKDEEIYTNLEDVLNMFDGEENLSISIKVEKNSLDE